VPINPYYQDTNSRITIYHGRCEDVLPFLPVGAVDLVVTSPPYNMGLVPGGNGRGMYRPGANSRAGRFRDGYGAHDDAMPQERYDEWQRAVLAALWRVVGDDGAIYYNHRPRVEHGKVRLPLGLDFGGLTLGQIITWDRGTGIGVNLRRYASAYEWLLLFAKPGFRLRDHAASGRSDMWRLGMEHDETGHPAPFPLGLPARAIRDSGAMSVLDPFCGSGTTLRAAKDAGIRAIGVDVEERFCELAARRLQQAVLPLGVS